MKPGRRLGYFLKGLWAIARAKFSYRLFPLSHLVTSKCDCRCPICLWRGYSEEELSTEEIISIYEEARGRGLRPWPYGEGSPF